MSVPAPVGALPWRHCLLPGLAAMAAYTCMYAFRKPYAAATYDAEGADYKAGLVIAQTVGYACSKFVGVGVVGRLGPKARAPLLLGLVGCAWLALLGFALLPPAWRWPMLFLNGLPLGMVWGVVFSYLEGRRATEMMAALLAASLIFSSALVKAVGKTLLLWGVEAAWMPLLCAALFVPPLLLCVRRLEAMPPPASEDRIDRAPRRPLSGSEQRRLLSRYLPGLAMLAAGYAAVSVLRDVRDNFEADLLAELGHGGNAGLFLWLELPAAVAALCVAASLVCIRDHARCLWGLHGLLAGGLAGVFATTAAFRAGMLEPLWWLALTGLCLSVAYVPFNCAFFERLVATFRIRGNVGFFSCLLDGVAYVGSCSLLIGSQWLPEAEAWVGRYVAAALVLPVVGAAGVLGALQFFRRRHGRRTLRRLSISREST